jgi:CRISPR-associated protein Cas5t
MEVYSVDITTMTSSFRYPMLISGTQLTLEVPPLSTILGLINAAAGHYLSYKGCFIGYYFEYGGKAIDVETIYMAEINKKGNLLPSTRSNVVKREFLFDNFLRLYCSQKKIIDYLKCPYFPIVLGRSSDLATINVKSIQRRILKPIQNADKIKGQIIPFSQGQLPGRIQPLSKYFTNTNPRHILGKEPYSIINYQATINSPLKAFRDEINDQEVDIYFHHIDSSMLE